MNARISKARESTDRDLNTDPMDCCRLCTRRGNGATGRILNCSKSLERPRATKPQYARTGLNLPPNKRARPSKSECRHYDA
ncbi:hypothetical protein AVEN_26825-1 [Araneus ventricosus]|uniref:Uncharacterized protein n=1 Tax=Araneus ventricosus TaxID=182803 RepID=A0A4Y2KK96_ARAVE|nr:hypothetical protein AVEN_26825-1 [Araneus ventricosus]